jgi:hypothetical protein
MLCPSMTCVDAQQPTLSNYIPQDLQKDSLDRERENLGGKVKNLLNLGMEFWK